MISFTELLENTQRTSGMLAQTAVNVVPIPGASIILSPVAAKTGEMIGGKLPSINKTPNILKDSLKIYSSAKDKNTSIILKDQLEKRKKYLEKAEKLGYNKIGQTAAAIDPTFISIIPNSIIKK